MNAPTVAPTVVQPEDVLDLKIPGLAHFLFDREEELVRAWIQALLGSFLSENEAVDMYSMFLAVFGDDPETLLRVVNYHEWLRFATPTS